MTSARAGRAAPVASIRGANEAGVRNMTKISWRTESSRVEGARDSAPRSSGVGPGCLRGGVSLLMEGRGAAVGPQYPKRIIMSDHVLFRSLRIVLDSEK